MPENDKNVSGTQWKLYNRKVETKMNQNVYNLFEMGAVDGDTLMKALRVVVDRFTNSINRKVFDCFCDSFLKPVDRFVRFCTGNWFELCPERIIKRILVQTTTRSVLYSDETWQILLKPDLSCSSLTGWCEILLTNPALPFKHFCIQQFNHFFQHLLIYQSGCFLPPAH